MFARPLRSIFQLVSNNFGMVRTIIPMANTICRYRAGSLIAIVAYICDKMFERACAEEFSR